MKKWLLVTNAVTLILLGAFAWNKYKTKNKPPDTHCFYELGLFDFHYKPETATDTTILMLGDSHVHFGDWSRLLDRQDVVNRGIGGDNFHCLCERTKYLETMRPKIVFIQVGSNDLPPIHLDTMMGYEKQLVTFWKSKGAIPVLTSVPFMATKGDSAFWYKGGHKKFNAKVAAFNTLQSEYAKAENLDFIDLNASLTDGKILKGEYTTDGIHLSESAYRVWADKIKAVLARHHILPQQKLTRVNTRR